MTAPSEAAMREAVELVNSAGVIVGSIIGAAGLKLLHTDIALALDRHAAAQRERDANLMRELRERAKRPEQRICYATGELAINRGRNLTASEQLENLAAAFEEWGDPLTAAAIRSAP